MYHLLPFVSFFAFHVYIRPELARFSPHVPSDCMGVSELIRIPFFPLFERKSLPRTVLFSPSIFLGISPHLALE